MIVGESCLRETGEGVMLAVRVTPRASRAAIGGLRDGRLVVRVTAPPTDGSANTAVRKLVAKTFSLPPSAVRVARGESSREKNLELRGVSLAAARCVLDGLEE